MKVRVDATKCTGYTLCNQAAPQIYKLDEWGFAYVDAEGVSSDLAGFAREGAEACPEKAISIGE